jgi:hypothetical protein
MNHDYEQESRARRVGTFGRRDRDEPAPDMGGRCYRSAARFLCADGRDIFTVRLDGKN